MYGVRKVIVSTSGVGTPIIDIDGMYGMTDNCFGIQVLDITDAELLVQFLQSKIFRMVVNACSWSVFRLDHVLFNSFRVGFWRGFTQSGDTSVLNRTKCQAVTTK